MNKPCITIMHKLPNRIRIKLSSPIKNVEKMKTDMMNEGIISFRYNSIIHTVLVYIDNSKIGMEEIISRIKLLFSLENEIDTDDVDVIELEAVASKQRLNKEKNNKFNLDKILSAKVFNLINQRFNIFNNSGAGMVSKLGFVAKTGAVVAGGRACGKGVMRACGRRW